MRALTKEEIAYLTANDPVSLSRIPVIVPCLDSGDYRFDKEQQVTNEDYIDYGDVVHQIQNCIPEQQDALAIAMLSAMGSVIGVAVNEYDWNQEDYPVSLQDISRVAALSGAESLIFVFNHTDYHEPQVRSIFSAVKKITLDIPMDDARIIAMYNYIGMGPKVNNVVTINLKEDTSTAILHEKNQAYFMVSVKSNPKGNFQLANQEVRSLWGHDKIVKQTYLDSDRTFDFSLGGKLKGVDKPHMERWKFYKTKDQLEPIRYEDWKRQMVAWDVNTLIDPGQATDAPQIYTPQIKEMPQIVFALNDLPKEAQSKDMPLYEIKEEDPKEGSDYE